MELRAFSFEERLTENQPDLILQQNLWLFEHDLTDSNFKYAQISVLLISPYLSVTFRGVV